MDAVVVDERTEDGPSREALFAAYDILVACPVAEAERDAMDDAIDAMAEEDA